MKHSTDVRENPVALGQIETKVTRAYRARLTAITVVGIAALALGGFVIARDGTGSNTPPGNGFASPGPGSTTQLTYYRNEQKGFQVRFPSDWQVGGFEGSIEFTPSGLPGLTVGEDSFSVEIMELVATYDDVNRDRTWTETTVGEQPAIRTEILGEPHQIFYRVDWTTAKCPPAAPCPRPAEDTTLQILIHGSTDTLWTQYAEGGESLVDSIEATARSENPTGLVVTAHGKVQADVAYDDATSTLVRFMDARIEGIGAEPYMTKTAKGQYAAREGEFGLYVYGDQVNNWYSYAIVERADVDANSSEFTVKLTTRNEQNQEVTATETIGVGRGGDGFEIRFSNLEGFEGGSS